jgi:Ca2+-binding EF-hand superfamily protein
MRIARSAPALLLLITCAAVSAQENEPLEESPEQRFQRLDRNGDGKLVPDGVGPQLRRWFGRLDRDGDGTLNASELRPILERRRGNR